MLGDGEPQLHTPGGGAPSLDKGALSSLHCWEQDKYRKVAKLGQGAFGAVWEVVDVQSGEHLALKFIDKSQTSCEVVEKEIVHHMRLKHPHVIKLRELVVTDDSIVLVMEYAAGGDLSQLVPAGRGLPEDQARWYFTQLAFALNYVHSMKVASRDIKLENLLVTDRGTHPIVKLADFGLSVESRSSLGSIGNCEGVCGTPAYLSPEVVANCRGGTYSAKKADMWACGVALYILLTGCCPFQRIEDLKLPPRLQFQALLRRILRADYRMPRGLSKECQDVLTRLLEKDPTQRMTSTQLLLHPWVCKDVDPVQLLQLNKRYVVASMADAPQPELLAEVRAVLREAQGDRAPESPESSGPYAPCTPSEPSAGSGALPVSGTQSSADSRLAPAGLMSSCANNDLAAMAD